MPDFEVITVYVKMGKSVVVDPARSNDHKYLAEKALQAAREFQSDRNWDFLEYHWEK